MSKADKEGRTYRGKALPLDDDAAHSAGKFLAMWLPILQGDLVMHVYIVWGLEIIKDHRLSIFIRCPGPWLYLNCCQMKCRLTAIWYCCGGAWSSTISVCSIDMANQMKHKVKDLSRWCNLPCSSTLSQCLISTLRMYKLPSDMLILCIHLHSNACMQVHKTSCLQVKMMKMRRRMRRMVNMIVKRVAQRKVAMKMTMMMKMQRLRAANCKLTEMFYFAQLLLSVKSYSYASHSLSVWCKFVLQFLFCCNWSLSKFVLTTKRIVDAWWQVKLRLWNSRSRASAGQCKFPEAAWLRDTASCSSQNNMPEKADKLIKDKA